MDRFIHRRLLTTVATTASETSTNSTAEAELTQANFDTNMVIILAALLCALICALGLNSMARCVLGCSRRETVVSERGSTTSKGLKKSVLKKVPIYVYGRDYQGSVEGDSEEECPICLGEFVDGDKVRVLPKCNHGFHVGCIDTWLGSNSSCPNCRHSVVDDGNGLGKVAAVGGGGGGGQEHVVVEIS